MKKCSLLGVAITVANYQQITDEISLAAKTAQHLTIAPIASHPLVLAQKNLKLKQILNSFDYVLPDSQYVRWALNLLHSTSLKNRIYGPKLLLKICSMAERNKLRIFLYGNMFNKLANSLKKKFPKLEIDGIDLKYKRIKASYYKRLVKKLVETNAKILIIGLGSPVQHEIAYCLPDIKMPIVMVGAAFDFISGFKSQAPGWMQNIGLEWLYRLLQEPRRLWKRYLLYGPFFVLLILKRKLNFTNKE